MSIRPACLALALFAIVAIQTSGALLDPLRRRLRAVEASGNVEDEPGLLGQIGATMLPRSEKIRQTLRLLLLQAGWRDPAALSVLYAISWYHDGTGTNTHTLHVRHDPTKIPTTFTLTKPATMKPARYMWTSSCQR